MVERGADVSERSEPCQHVWDAEVVSRQRDRLHRLLRVVFQLLDVLAVGQAGYFGLMRKHWTPPRLSVRVGRDVFKTAATARFIRLVQVGNAPSVGLLTHGCP